MEDEKYGGERRNGVGGVTLSYGVWKVKLASRMESGPTFVYVYVRAEDNHSETLWANIDAGCYRNNGQTCRDNAMPWCSPRTLYSRRVCLCLYSRSLCGFLYALYIAYNRVLDSLIYI